LKWAYSPSGRAAAGGFAGGAGGAGAVCANAATPVTIIDNSIFDMKRLHRNRSNNPLKLRQHSNPIRANSGLFGFGRARDTGMAKPSIVNEFARIRA
jgi:hypothetical protein